MGFSWLWKLCPGALMISSWLIWLLIVQYVVIAVASACERNWPRCLYFVSAGLISLSVLWMSAR